MVFLLQDPNDIIRYGFNWEGFGALESAIFTITPSGPTVVDVGDTGNIANCEVSGLEFGKTYSVTCVATLESSEVVQQSMTILCAHK